VDLDAYVAEHAGDTVLGGIALAVVAGDERTKR